MRPYYLSPLKSPNATTVPLIPSMSTLSDTSKKPDLLNDGILLLFGLSHFVKSNAAAAVTRRMQTRA